MKQSIVFVIMLFYLQIFFGITNCEIVDSKSGTNGVLEFVCDEDTSLKDNKVIFYIVGDTDIDSIKVSDGKVKFDIEDITKDVKRVSVNLYTEWLLGELDYEAYRNEPVKLQIDIKKDSNPNYKILWGGVVDSSYESKKNKNNNLQFYRNNEGSVYIVKNGLACSIADDCDDKIYLTKDCSSASECKRLKQKFAIYQSFGVVHQRNI